MNSLSFPSNESNKVNNRKRKRRTVNPANINSDDIPTVVQIDDDIENEVVVTEAVSKKPRGGKYDFTRKEL